MLQKCVDIKYSKAKKTFSMPIISFYYIHNIQVWSEILVAIKTTCSLHTADFLLIGTNMRKSEQYATPLQQHKPRERCFLCMTKRSVTWEWITHIILNTALFTGEATAHRIVTILFNSF